MHCLIVIFIVFLVHESRSTCQRNPEEKRTICQSFQFTSDVNSKTLLIEGGIGALTKDDFAELSEPTEIIITSSYVEEIEEGALCAPNNLTAVSLLRNKNLPKLTKKALKNCQKLKSVYIEDAIVEEGAFVDMKNVEVLSISEAKFWPTSHLTKDSLSGLNNVKNLALRSCGLTNIEKNAFDALTFLEFLDLKDNHFKDIPSGTFEKLKGLRVLDLSNNSLANISWQEFKGLKSLQVLFLDKNYVSDVKIDALMKDVPSLERIFLDSREFSEEKLEKISKKFAEEEVTVIFV